MEPTTTIAVGAIAALVVFFTLLVVLKYAIKDNFTRTRLIMTSFLIFIVVTLSISFWRYAVPSLPFAAPAFLVGALLGYQLGVKAAKRRLLTEEVTGYMQHFARIRLADVKAMNWWSIVNFYSIMGGLVLINLVGLTTVIFNDNESLAIATAAVGAFFIGTIVPYIIHLWSVRHERI